MIWHDTALYGAQDGDMRPGHLLSERQWTISPSCWSMIQSCALLACNAALMPADLELFVSFGWFFLAKNGFSAGLERKVLDCHAGLCILMPAFTCVRSYVLLCLLLALLLEGGINQVSFWISRRVR